MVTSIVLYVSGSASQRIPAHGAPTGDGTTVTMDIENIQNNYSELVCNLIVKPGPGLVDSATDGLNQDLTVAVTSVTTPVKRTYAKGMLPGYFPVPLTLARDVERWPFDSYYTGPITVTVFTGPEQVPERANVTFVDRSTGWKVDVTSREQRQCVVTVRSQIAAIGEHNDIRDRHPVHLRRDRGSRLIRCGGDRCATHGGFSRP